MGKLESCTRWRMGNRFLIKSTRKGARRKKIMAKQKEKKYSGYGYHGGGRKATGIKRVSICISGQPEQIEKLKKMAAQEEKTVSAFILEKTGINKTK